MNGRRAKTSPIRFLVVSLTVVAALCVALLSFLAFYMNRRNTDTINSVGSFYMSEMSQQSAKTCQSALRLRLDQVHDLAEAVGPGDGRTPEELYQLLSYNASASFLSVSLWAEDGHHEVVSGPRVDVVDPEPFLASLNAGEDKAAVGTAADGQSVILLGVSARYPMSGGGNSCALVAAIPASYLDGFIPLNEDNGEFYSIIIRRDGTYIISPSDATRENYFDRVRDTYEVSGGDTEAFIQRLVDGMDDPADYTSEFTIDGKRQHLYCTNLAYSEWHLLTFTSYGTLDSAISRLSRQWSVMIFSVCAALLVAGGLWVSNLHGILGIYEIPFWLGAPLSMVIIVYVVNAINLIDGIDGLASGLSAAAFIIYGTVFGLVGKPVYAVMSFAALGVLVPFFYYNVFGNPVKRKKIFMGDTGSLTIGLLLTFMGLQILVYSPEQVPLFGTNVIVMAVSPLIIPCFDVIRVFAFRLIHHGNPFLPDKSHIHHKLLAIGMPQKAAMVSIVIGAVFFSALNIFLSRYLNVNALLFIDIFLWTAANYIINRLISKHKGVAQNNGNN